MQIQHKFGGSLITQRWGDIFKIYRFFILVGVLSLVLDWGGDGVREALRYERQGLQSGDWWRVITGHWVHVNTRHLWLNLGGLALIAVLFARRFAALVWLGLGMLCSLAISAGLYVFCPWLDWYVGLSGVLHGFMIAGAVGDVRNGQRSSWILLLAVASKLAWEQVAGAVPGSEASIGARVIVEAHLIGGLTGFAVAWFLPLRRTALATTP